MGRNDLILYRICRCSASFSKRWIFGPIRNEQKRHKSVNAVKFNSSLWFCACELFNIFWFAAITTLNIYTCFFFFVFFSCQAKQISSAWWIIFFTSFFSLFCLSAPVCSHFSANNYVQQDNNNDLATILLYATHFIFFLSHEWKNQYSHAVKEFQRTCCYQADWMRFYGEFVNTFIFNWITTILFVLFLFTARTFQVNRSTIS